MNHTQNVLILSFLFLLSCSDSSEDSEPTAFPRIDPYICKTIQYSPQISTFGIISPVRKADILPPADSIIRKMYFDEGDLVFEGDILAELDMQQIDLQIKEAEASLHSKESSLELSRRKLAESRRNAESRFHTIESAEIELKKKEIELLRMSEILANKKKLHALGGITKDELLSFELNFLEKESLFKQAGCSLEIKKIGYRDIDLINENYVLSSDPHKTKMDIIDLNTGVFQAETDMAESELEAAVNKLESLRLYREENIITSPLKGIILRRLMDEGEKGTREKPLYHICSVDKVYVSCRLSEKDLLTLSLNQRAQISSPLLDESTSGSVQRISPWIESESGSGEVMILVDNEDGIFRFGQFVRVTLELEEPQTELMIPSESLIDGFAYLLRDNHIFKTQLITGSPRDGMIPVYKGLSEGDRIVLAPLKSFTDGMEIGLP